MYNHWQNAFPDDAFVVRPDSQFLANVAAFTKVHLNETKRQLRVGLRQNVLTSAHEIQVRVHWERVHCWNVCLTLGHAMKYTVQRVSLRQSLLMRRRLRG
jgi:hypothetical protein